MESITSRVMRRNLEEKKQIAIHIMNLTCRKKLYPTKTHVSKSPQRNLLLRLTDQLVQRMHDEFDDRIKSRLLGAQHINYLLTAQLARRSNRLAPESIDVSHQPCPDREGREFQVVLVSTPVTTVHSEVNPAPPCLLEADTTLTPAISCSEVSMDISEEAWPLDDLSTMFARMHISEDKSSTQTQSNQSTHFSTCMMDDLARLFAGMSLTEH